MASWAYTKPPLLGKRAFHFIHFYLQRKVWCFPQLSQCPPERVLRAYIRYLCIFMWRLCGNHLVKECVDHRNVSFDTRWVCAESVMRLLEAEQHDFHSRVNLPTIYATFPTRRRVHKTPSLDLIGKKTQWSRESYN